MKGNPDIIPARKNEVYVNQKGHLTKHQYSFMSEPKGDPWPELQVN